MVKQPEGNVIFWKIHCFLCEKKSLGIDYRKIFSDFQEIPGNKKIEDAI